MDLSPIQRHYENANVFITGATGFIGKYLMEKLLRSCPQVNRIFILLRPKRNKTIEERFEILLQEPVFQKINLTNFREKIVLIPGNLSEKNLGISPENQQLLIDSINVVFHSAANVNFNQPIPRVVQTNVIATRDLLLMARKMEKLTSFVYISTAYSHCNKPVIAERAYGMTISCDNLINMVETIDERIIEKMTPILIQDWPNTYAFSKAVAEDCVNKYGQGLPVCIVRPSIVATTAKESTVGWTDNIYGITGQCYAYLTGYIRIIICNVKTTFDVVPADYTGNFILASAWDQTNRKTDSVQVYNYVSGERNPIKCGQVCDFANEYGPRCPTTTAGGYLLQIPTKHVIVYKILTFFFHIIPAAIIDLSLKLKGDKPKAMALYNKVHGFAIATGHFVTTDWIFKEENTLNLLHKMDGRDKELFPVDIVDIKWADYMWGLICGVRKYLCKEDPSTIPQAIKRQQKLKIVYYTVVFSASAILFYILYKFISLFV